MKLVWNITFLLLGLAAGQSLLASPYAMALDVEPAIGVYYFSSDDQKVQDAQTESAEDGQKFSARRPMRAVARDLAREELRHGNVCLTQAETDLRAALRSKQLLSLCHKIFKDDFSGPLQAANYAKLEPDFLRCSATVEARETAATIRLFLSFRGDLVMRSRVPTALRKAGFPEVETAFALPTRQAPLGPGAAGWKALLTTGSCSLDEGAFSAFLERILAQRREAQALARCQNRQLRQAENLSRLQKQFKDYVPDEWLKESGDTKAQSFLQAAAPATKYSSLEECRAGYASTSHRLQALRKVSARIAERHDLPALDPANQAGSREPASEDDF